MQKQYLLGYLYVLNYMPTIDLLSVKEQRLAKESMIGCLFEVSDFFKQNNHKLYALIQKRESLNNEKTGFSEEFKEATKELSVNLYYYLRNNYEN